MVDPALSARQRSPVPMDRWSARRGTAPGGYDTTMPLTLVNGIENTYARYPATVFDGQIRRDRGPYFAAPRYIPPPVTWISWTAAGPTRPELGMRNITLREMVGNTRSRFPTIPDAPTKGMHTMTPRGRSDVPDRYVVTAQMVPGRYDRLANAVYAGQTFSQTTRPQGR